jgi:recombination protein RecA
MDLAMGGGLPEGRIVHLSGPQSCGKTSLSLQFVVNLQLMDYASVYEDLERTFDPAQSSVIGIENLTIARPFGGEVAFDIALDAFDWGARLAVLDSVPFLNPKSVLEKVEEDSEARGYAGVATLFTNLQEKMVRTTEQTKAVLLLINQIRDNQKSSMGGRSYPGGWVVKHVPSIHIDLLYSSVDKDKPGCITTYFEVKKNKTWATQGMKSQFDIRAGVIDLGESLAREANSVGLIQKSGSWFRVNDELTSKLGLGEVKAQGAANMGELLEGELELYKALYRETLIRNSIDINLVQLS